MFYLFIHLFIYLFVCLFVYLFIYYFFIIILFYFFSMTQLSPRLLNMAATTKTMDNS